MRPIVRVLGCRKTGPGTMIAMSRSLLRSTRWPMSKSPLRSGCNTSLKSGAARRLLSVPILAVLILYAPIKGFAAEPLHCLTGEEQRAATTSGKTVPIATVIHTLRRAPKDVIKAQLCQEPDRLIYKLTLLGRDGKVKRAIVDATNGAVVGER